ncbi:MAG: hypothetical protein HC879_00180 [Leptolyngbyaceae cyanobacterium SL_5_9]|nr:hypothetical protein [Leptolyngbyaceae cyanobacterium SL_5_9]
MNRKASLNYVVTAIAITLGLFIPLPAFAGPALYWWHMTVNTPQSECLDRVRLVMADERVPLRRENNGTIWGWHDDVTTSIRCANQGNNSHVTIIVTSNDQEFASYLLDVFRRGIGGS